MNTFQGYNDTYRESLQAKPLNGERPSSSPLMKMINLNLKWVGKYLYSDCSKRCLIGLLPFDNVDSRVLIIMIIIILLLSLLLLLLLLLLLSLIIILLLLLLLLLL